MPDCSVSPEYSKPDPGPGLSFPFLRGAELVLDLGIVMHFQLRVGKLGGPGCMS